MPAQNSLLTNPMIAMASPDQQQSLLQLQQRQAIGQAMLQEGMQPIDTSNAQVGGLAYRVSPLQGVAKLLQTYLGNKMAMDSLGQQGQLMGQIYGNAFGQDQQAPVAQSAPPVAASGDSGSLTGPTAGMGGMQGTPSPQALGATLQQNGVATPTQTVSTPGTFSLPGHTAAESRQLYMMNPEEYAKARMAFVTPTDATRVALAAHMDPQAANAAAQFKANYVAPVTGTGIFRDPHSMQPVAYNPDMPAGSTPLFDASGNVAAAQSIPNAQAVMQGNAAATAGGGAQYQLQDVWDPTANGGAGGMVKQTVSNAANAANGTAPLPMRNNNPGAVSPGGTVAKYPDMQTGLAAMDKNLADYAGKPGGDTLGGVITKWVGSPANAPAYIKDVTTRLGIPAGQKVDLTNPAQRLAISTAIMLHENGPNAVFATGGAGASQSSTPAAGGAYAAAPPLGQTANANTAQQASADSMKTSYAKLQGINSSANGALDALQKMQTLAANKNPALTAGALGTAVAPLMSPDAAEYEKQRANVVSLLANQNGTNGSDAGRALTGESVPDYGKPKQAIQDGLQTQINQVRAQQLKANVLTPVYQTGDSKAYTTLENQFDQTVKPSMMPQLTTLVSMPAGPQRAIALKQAIADPQMKSALDLMVQTGQLK